MTSPRSTQGALPAPITLAEIDAALLAAWRQFNALLAGQVPATEVPDRFCRLGLFPKPAWGWLAGGEAQALQTGDVQQLHGTLQRVLACAHACWGRPGPDGLHNGFDHCAAVTPALHALALGPGYAAAVFHPGRGLSRNGHAPLRHAANLLVLLHHPAWPHRAKAIEQAQAAATGKGGNAADRAFIGTLLALATADAALLQQALPRFAQEYTRTDWGRHQPERQPLAVANLLALARRHLPQAVEGGLEAELLSPERLALWRAHAQALAAGGLAPHAWGGALAFLDYVPGTGAAG